MIQPLVLDSLFNITEDKNIKVKSEDFLFELLKNVDDKNLIKEFITHSNLSEEEKKSLFEKFQINNIEIKNKIENKVPLNISTKDTKVLDKKPLKTEIKNLLNIYSKHKNLEKENSLSKEAEKKSFLEKLINDDKTFEDTIEKMPLHLQTDIVKEVKNILVSKAKLNTKVNMLVNTKEFKEVSTIKDLFNLTEKFKLNLTKIIVKTENNNSKSADLIKNIVQNNHSDIKNLILNNNTKKINQKIQTVSKNSDTLKNRVLKKTDLGELIRHERNKNNININDQISIHKKDNSKHESKENTNISLSDIKNEFKQKIIEAKQSIQHFASSLKEAVENYKPPLTKLSLELHPKELGKVEVVIKQQGDNLNVQINTNNQSTISFLTSQQNELKNSLVNMGFTNINMNFNSNSNDHNRKHQKQNQFQQVSDLSNEDDELIIDFTYKYA